MTVRLPCPLAELPTPALLVDGVTMAGNIAAVAARARDAGVALRPHFKTSKCLKVAQAQLRAGAVGFTCATADEVAALRSIGVGDILWAHQPVGPAKVAFAVQDTVGGPDGGLSVSLDSVTAAEPLARAATAAGVTVAYLVEVDTGQGRCGVAPADAVTLAGELAGLPGLRMRGIFTHEGHLSRYVGDRPALEAAGRAVGEVMARTAAELRSAGHPCGIVSVGSTPGVTSAPYVPGVTEARPGTYVYHDANQVLLGSAEPAGCALSVLARVVTVRGGADPRAIIDAGTKAMSSDPPASGTGFGAAGDGLAFGAANEEHGYLSGPAVTGLRVGATLRITPNHACATVNMWGGLYVVDGERAVEYWPIVARH